jgi:FlaG/FlaF family flagellin (archaellin)
MERRIALVELARAVARPAITIILAATVAQVVTQGIEAPAQFWGLAIMSITWWFGERTAQHIKEQK